MGGRALSLILENLLWCFGLEWGRGRGMILFCHPSCFLAANKSMGLWVLLLLVPNKNTSSSLAAPLLPPSFLPPPQACKLFKNACGESIHMTLKDQMPLLWYSYFLLELHELHEMATQRKINEYLCHAFQNKGSALSGSGRSTIILAVSNWLG